MARTLPAGRCRGDAAHRRRPRGFRRGGSGGRAGVRRGLTEPRSRCWRESRARRVTARARRRRCDSNGARSTSAQPAGLAAQRLDDPGGLLVVAPDEHRRARAGDRRAERAEVARAADEVHRARVEVLAARLVQAVVEPGRDEVPVAARQPEHQQRGVGGVEDRVAHRHLGGQRGARLLRAHGRVRARRARPRGRSAARSGARGRRRTRRTRPGSAAATLSGWPSSSVASASRSASSSKTWSAAMQARDVGGRARAQAARQRDVGA